MARRVRALVLSFAALRGALVALSATLLLAPAAGAQSGCDHALEYGMNPSFQIWSSRAIVFADAAQRVRGYSFWVNGQPGADAPTIAYGARGEGWPDPAQLAPGARYGAYLFGSMEHTLPDGRSEPYVVTWSGAGEARLEGRYVVSERNRGPGRVEVFVDPTRGNGNSPLSLSYTATSAADPLRDVHVWLPGMEHADAIFWPPFVERVRTLDAGHGPHTWRSLDWSRVNSYGRSLAHGGFVFDRAGVITPRSPSQGTFRGVAPEYQVALCNALGMNLHLQLPHRTDDLPESEYVRFLADQLRLVRDGSPGVPGLYGGRAFERLDPSLTVTVELSNEIWNSIFPVNAWMTSEAARKGIPFSQQIADQIHLLFDVARSVFTGPDAPRLRTYVAGFVGDPGFIRRILDRLPTGTHVDALGPAAYLGPRRPDMDAWLVGASSSRCPNCPDEAELLATADAAVDRLAPQIGAHRDLALAYANPDGSHPALELYEGGLNLKAAGQPWAATAIALQTSPKLFTLFTRRYVPMLVREGVELVNWYSLMTDQDSPSVDAFGVWNDMEQTLTLPVVEPYLDEGAPKAAVVCLGPPLASACPLASATVRSAPGNLDVYRATPPALGRLFHAEVDLVPSGNAGAFVIGSLLPTSVPLPSGQTVLSSLSNAELLSLRPGPLASWDVRVPNDAQLAGIAITTQAFLLGGGVSVNLSNAMDLVFGR